MLSTDVCIVGAGPAGSVLSMMLSKKKINHVLIDKSEFPRDKTCGDGLILYVFQVLKEIDPELLHKFLNHPNFIYSRDFHFYINNYTKIDIKYHKDVLHAPMYFGKRIDFDNFLVENTPSDYLTSFFGNGVKNVERVDNFNEVTLVDGTIIRSKIIVGADGIQSIVSKKLGLNSLHVGEISTFVSSYFKNVEIDRSLLSAEVRIVRKGMPLFFYIFPLANNEVNVSLGGSSIDIKKYKIDLRKEIESIINSHPKVSSKFKNAEQVCKWRGWGIPCNFDSLKISGDGFLLVGDAAGLANSFYKEGVGTGMMSGLIASNLIQEALEKKEFSEDSFKSYRYLLENEFGRLLKFGQLAYRFSKRKYFFNFSILLIKSYLERKIIGVIDKRTF